MLSTIALSSLQGVVSRWHMRAVFFLRAQEMKWGGVFFCKKMDFSPQNETKVNQTLLCN